LSAASVAGRAVSLKNFFGGVLDTPPDWLFGACQSPACQALSDIPIWRTGRNRPCFAPIVDLMRALILAEPFNVTDVGDPVPAANESCPILETEN
jgi:hypothetical protein